MVSELIVLTYDLDYVLHPEEIHIFVLECNGKLLKPYARSGKIVIQLKKTKCCSLTFAWTLCFSHSLFSFFLLLKNHIPLIGSALLGRVSWLTTNSTSWSAITFFIPSRSDNLSSYYIAVRNAMHLLVILSVAYMKWLVLLKVRLYSSFISLSLIITC